MQAGPDPLPIPIGPIKMQIPSPSLKNTTSLKEMKIQEQTAQGLDSRLYVSPTLPRGFPKHREDQSMHSWRGKDNLSDCSHTGYKSVYLNLGHLDWDGRARIGGQGSQSVSGWPALAHSFLGPVSSGGGGLDFETRQWAL